MTEPTTEDEAPSGNVTQRLVFDTAATEDDIPEFLRKGKEVKSLITLPVTKQGITTSIPENPVAVQETRSYDGPVESSNDSVELSVETQEGEVIAKRGTIKPVSEEHGPIPDVSELSVEQLQQLEGEIERKKKEKQAAEKATVIAQIIEVAATYNVTVDEIVDAMGGMKVKRKGVKATQKYMDPKTGATWSGRGKEPIWIRGKKREKFLIPE